jgi:glycosyltransferase involved in cell wall biosynthesis
MNNPIVSVHMITYNHEPYIAQAIEGILRQETDFPIEIIIGEDCSTDGTRDIVFDYQKRHPDIIEVINSGRNVGMLENSARVRKACRGKYIAYCEGDDYWHHSLKLQKQVDCLETHPEVGLVHGDINRLYQEQNRIIHGVNKLKNVDYHDIASVFEALLLGNYTVFACTVCVRKELIDAAFKEEECLMKNAEIKMIDLPLWLSISRHNKFVYFPESWVTYRILSESASHSKSEAKNLAFKESSKRVRLYFAKKYECSSDVRAAVEARYYTALLKTAYHTCNKKLAKETFCRLSERDNGRTFVQWMWFLGASYGAVKFMTLPFLFLRQMWLRYTHRYV